MSGGEYVSLGFFERDDLASVGDALFFFFSRGDSDGDGDFS